MKSNKTHFVCRYLINIYIEKEISNIAFVGSRKKHNANCTSYPNFSLSPIPYWRISSRFSLACLECHYCVSREWVSCVHLLLLISRVTLQSLFRSSLLKTNNQIKCLTGTIVFHYETDLSAVASVPTLSCSVVWLTFRSRVYLCLEKWHIYSEGTES